MISAVKLERCMINIGILSIVLDKLHPKKKLYLVVLLKIDKISKIYLHLTIQLFGPAVCLQIESGE